ncbi:MAG: hypothetical protein DMF40_06960 [Verrucomicrobia bacterium]|nr:MAG: hypothetical protein DME38_02020 [Verrucomicrobiota bacterium]PYL47826.1 MAG: hypothetical protein DMF40_06960 [Verrucomicrobiota bacterium]
MAFAAVACHLKDLIESEMEAAARQRSEIYFKRHKASRCRAVLFRRLRASATNQTCDLKQLTLGNTYITQELSSGQRLLKGFAS